MENIPTSKQENNPEKKEQISTIEDVQSILEKILEGQEYKKTYRKEDEKGLYSLEARIITPEGISEFSYRRKGTYDINNEKRVDVIHVIFFDENNHPIGGDTVAKRIEGEWKLTP